MKKDSQKTDAAKASLATSSSHLLEHAEQSGRQHRRQPPVSWFAWRPCVSRFGSSRYSAVTIRPHRLERKTVQRSVAGGAESSERLREPAGAPGRTAGRRAGAVARWRRVGVGAGGDGAV